MNNKKIVIVSSIIIVVLVLTLGITYSIFSLSKVSKNSSLVVGDIYMHYNETTNSINITDTMPLTEKTYNITGVDTSTEKINICSKYLYNIYGIKNCSLSNKNNKSIVKFIQQEQSYVIPRVCGDELSVYESYCENNLLNAVNNNVLTYNDIEVLYDRKVLTGIVNDEISKLNYFEFTIDGKNTHTKYGVLYNIQLVHGDTEANKIRIEDKFLKFRLVEVNNNQENILQDKLTIENINSTTIYSSTIPANTTSEITRTYRLYMWIDENVNICSGDITDNCDYTLTDWSNLFASIKVNVNGKYVEGTTFVEAVKNRYNGNNQDGLVAVNTDGDLVTTGDTIREYRYSGIGNYCTYTDGTTDYNISVSGNICPQTACYVSGDVEFVVTEDNDLFDIMGTTCTDSNGTTLNLKNNQTIPTDSGIRNYVTFNNETWRIVGIFNEENANGVKEERIKIVKDEPISANAVAPETITKDSVTYQVFNTEVTGTKYKYFYWNNPSSIETNKNDWTKAGSMYYLNENYLNSLENSNLIEDMKYYLGGLYKGTLKEIYAMERDKSNIIKNNQATWNGKIALLYPSDLGYARIPSGWGDAIINNKNYNNWMLNDQVAFWLLSPRAGHVAGAASWYCIDGLGWNFTDSDDALRPVLTLGSQTMIISGSGSINDPYLLKTA